MTTSLEAHLQQQIDNSHRFFWHRLRWRAVRRYVPPGPVQLVDIGAGAGLLGTFLAVDRPQATYRFVEPLQSLREFLGQRYGAEADAADDADYAGAGVVTLLDVLEHQEDDRGFMEELVNKMAPGARLVLTVPARQNLWSSWDTALGHYRRYDKASLSACLQGLPLAVDEKSYLFPEMVPLALLRKHRRPGQEGGHPQAEGPASEEAQFPNLPGLVNDALYEIGCGSLALRRRWPTGTSLFLAARLVG